VDLRCNAHRTVVVGGVFVGLSAHFASSKLKKRNPLQCEPVIALATADRDLYRLPSNSTVGKGDDCNVLPLNCRTMVAGRQTGSAETGPRATGPDGDGELDLGGVTGRPRHWPVPRPGGELAA
jgi:hypothetical protein